MPCAGYNLDPFEQFSDEELNEAVRMVRLQHKITCLTQEVIIIARGALGVAVWGSALRACTSPPREVVGTFCFGLRRWR